ncbi:MAG: hypothetical protein ACREQO_18210 [Candidatus Binatia bacterium]
MPNRTASPSVTSAADYFFNKVLGRQGVEFDARKFEHFGVPVRDTCSIGLTKASGVSSFEQWLAVKTPRKIGGTALGSSTDAVPSVLRTALGLPLQVVSSYNGDFRYPHRCRER